MGAFLHGGTSARVSVVLGAVIFGGIAVAGPTSLVGGLLSYAAFAFVGWHIIRAGKRLRGGRGRA